MQESNNQLDNTDKFVRLLMVHQDQIFTFILTLVPHWPDAEDLMQNVTSVMLKKFDDFQPGTNFSAWGKQIARYEIMNHRRQQTKWRFQFSEETMQAISDYVEPRHRGPENFLHVLQSCLQKLPEQDHQVIVLRYQPDATTKTVAKKLGISTHSVYRAVHRIHQILRRCVNRNLAAES